MDRLFDISAVHHEAREDRGVVWRTGTANECRRLLADNHYLGPLTSGGRHIFVGAVDGELVACQVWRLPTSRHLPSDGTWLELSRWCLTPHAGRNAGSRMHRFVARWLRQHAPHVTTLVSYSDPSAGHDGALYRSCNWAWAPTWHRLRPPPTGNGSWRTGEHQSVKDRWVFALRDDDRREAVLSVKDGAAARLMQT